MINANKLIAKRIHDRRANIRHFLLTVLAGRHGPLVLSYFKLDSSLGTYQKNLSPLGWTLKTANSGKFDNYATPLFTHEKIESDTGTRALVHSSLSDVGDSVFSSYVKNGVDKTAKRSLEQDIKLASQLLVLMENRGIFSVDTLYCFLCIFEQEQVKTAVRMSRSVDIEQCINSMLYIRSINGSSGVDRIESPIVRDDKNPCGFKITKNGYSIIKKLEEFLN